MSAFVALGIWRATHKHHITLSSVACTIFATSHTWHNFQKKKLLHIKCVFRFSLKFIRNMPHSKKKSARYCLTCLQIKYLLFLSDFNETWIFLTDFQKISRKPIHWKLSCSMQRDMTEQRVALLQFCEHT